MSSLFYKVLTSFDKNLIVQETSSEIGEFQQTLSRQVIALQDKGIREALIKLGWTPPPEPAGLHAENCALHCDRVAGNRTA